MNPMTGRQVGNDTRREEILVHAEITTREKVVDRSALQRLQSIREDHDEIHTHESNQYGYSHRPFFNRLGRLRVDSKLRELNALLGDDANKLDGLGDWEQTARIAFSKIDRNNNGCLEKKEILQAIKTMSEIKTGFGKNIVPNSEDLAARLMKTVDTNDDGKIDIDEFLAMVRSEVRAGRNAVSSHFLRVTKLAREILLVEHEKMHRNVEGDSTGLVNPTSSPYVLFTLLVSLGNLLLVFTLPLTLGWEEFNWWTTLMNILLEVLYILELCLNFFTGYIDEDDVIIMDAAKVRRRYFKGYFAIDLLSSLPTDFIFTVAQLMDVKISLLLAKTVLKGLKILRCLKLFYLGRSNPLFLVFRHVSNLLETKFKVSIPLLLIRLLRLVLLTFVLSHWVGSLQFLFARAFDFPEDSWISAAGLTTGVSNEEQWFWCLFRAMCHLILIGFESPPVTNTTCDTLSRWCKIEHWITLICLYIGAIYYSFLISSMLSIIQENSMADASFRQKLDELNGYMNQKSLPLTLRRQIREHFQNNFSSVEFEMMKTLSQEHVQAINRFCANDLVSAVPLLSGPENKAFSHCLTSYLVEVVASKGQVIFEANSIGDSMYFLKTGFVKLVSTFFHEKDDREGLITAGCFFGEVSLILDVPRTLSAIADSKCVLYRIEKDKLLLLLELFPDSAQRLRKIAKHRYQMHQHFSDPYSFPAPIAEDDAENILLDGSSPIMIDPEDRKTLMFKGTKGIDPEVRSND